MHPQIPRLPSNLRAGMCRQQQSMRSQRSWTALLRSATIRWQWVSRVAAACAHSNSWLPYSCISSSYIHASPLTLVYLRHFVSRPEVPPLLHMCKSSHTGCRPEAHRLAVPASRREQRILGICTRACSVAGGRCQHTLHRRSPRNSAAAAFVRQSCKEACSS